MPHISSIGAGLFSDLSIAMPASDPVFSSLDTNTEFAALFATEISPVNGTPASGTFVRVKNIREFPSMGVPPNIVNVPVYGQKSSQQIQGQSDTPSLEITLNYVPADWGDSTKLGALVGGGKTVVFRFSLLNAEPTGTADTKYASSAAGLGTVENSVYYWYGKVEALQVNPQLTDANTATLTLTLQSKFFGAYTQ